MQPTRLIFLLGLAGLLVGCVSTPQTRVERNPDLFATFSEEEKALILEGNIELGFTKEMVLLAAGSPDRKTKKTTSDGVREEWTYFKYGPPRSGYGYGHYGGWGYYGGSYSPYLSYHRSFYPFPAFHHRGRKIKDLVVNFENGAVVAFEEGYDPGT